MFRGDRLTGLVGLAGCLSLSVTAIGIASDDRSTQSTASSPLVIAVEGPQSGDQASNGLDMLRGVRLAVDQLNARGGLWDGRKVEIYRADDKGDEANARSVAHRVIAKGIHFVIGPYNSSVGIANLPVYRRSKVLPLWMTSRDETRGAGATVQPMNSQIAPVEERYVKAIGARRVTMLVDDTSNGAFTKGMATRLRAVLERDGATVTSISIREASGPTGTPAVPSGYYAGKVAEALATNPDLVYVSTYFPEGVEIAKALGAAGTAPKCLMGLANVDNGFVARTSLAEGQRCVFSGVPAAAQMPSAGGYVRRYRSRSTSSRASGARSPSTQPESSSRPSTGARATTSAPCSGHCGRPRATRAPPAASRSTRSAATARMSR